jgi:hypothetical protein
MKFSIFLIPIVFAKGLSDNQLQKRGWGNSFFASFRGRASDSSLAGSANQIDPGVSMSAAAKNADNLLFLRAALSHIDRLLSAKQYEQATFLLGSIGTTRLVYNDLVHLAVKKGDKAFLVEALNSSPRSVLGDLQLMKYARETTNPARAKFLSSTIADNMGDTFDVGNTGSKRYYDLFKYVTPATKAESLAKKFLAEASTEADRRVWGEIIRDIREFAV